MFYVQEIKNNCLSIHDKINFRGGNYYFRDFLALHRQLQAKVNCCILLSPYAVDMMQAQQRYVDSIDRYYGKTRYEYENNIN